MPRGRSRVARRPQGQRRARCTAGHPIPRPLGRPRVAIARLRISGRGDPCGRPWARPVRLPPAAGTGAWLGWRARGRGPRGMPLPGPAQRREAGARPPGLGGLRRLDRLQPPEAIRAARLGGALTCGGGAGAARGLKALALAFVPLQGRPPWQPVGGHRGAVVQGGPERLGYACEPPEAPAGREAMRGVRPLLPTRLEASQRAPPLQPAGAEALCGAPGQPPVPARAAHGTGTARCRPLQPAPGLPGNACAHGRRCVAVCEGRPPLQERPQRPPPWREARLATGRKEGRKIRGGDDGSEGVTPGERRMARRKRRPRHTQGVCRDRLDRGGLA